MRDKKLYVLGSLNKDIMISVDRMPSLGETINGYQLKETVGGKGGNQACAASKLGVDTYFIGNIGKDFAGKLIAEDLSKYDINLDFLNVVEDIESGTALIISCKGDNSIIINNGANYAIEINDVVNALSDSKPGDLFITQLEIPVIVALEGLKLAKQKGLVTIFNPAPAVQIDKSYYPYIDYLIMNETESQILTGILPSNEDEYIKVSEIMHGVGVATVIITLGSEGVFISDKATPTKLSVPGQKISVIDSTGAGDTFIGSFAYSLTKEWTIRERVIFSNIAAALACTKYGAKEGIPTVKEVLQLID